MQVDAGAGDLAKNLNMSYNEALATRKEFAKQANDSENIFVTTKGNTRNPNGYKQCSRN